MGMFDYLICERELPFLPEEIISLWGSASEIAFQTKDIENSLSCFKISSNGELLRKETETVFVGDGDPDAESIMDRFPKTQTIDKGWVEIKYNGSILFYDSYFYREEKTDRSGWVEYQAEFINGLLQGQIELAKHELPRNHTQAELEMIAERAEYFKAKKQERLDKEIEKINFTKSQIEALNNVCDTIYQSLIDDLCIQKESDKEGWLFDYVFNDSEYSFERLKEMLL